MQKIEAYVWDLKGVHANALSQFIKTANSEIDHKAESISTLDNIKKVLKKMKRINSTDHLALKELLSILPDKHKAIKSEIEALYKDLPQYTFVDDPDNPGQSKSQLL